MTIHALVISDKVPVAWTRKMLRDVALHDVIGGHQAHIQRKIYLFMAHRILYLAKATRGSRDARSARQDYKLASLATFGHSLREKLDFALP